MKPPHPLSAAPSLHIGLDPATVRGRRGELARLASEQRPRLRAAALRVLRDDEEAEDAVQDGLLSALRALPRFRGDAHMATWLYRIVINAALMRVRRRRTGDLLDHDRACAEAGPCPQARLESRSSLRRELRRIDDLPRAHREVLRLAVFEDLGHREAAARLGLTEGAVKVRLHRARRKLRDGASR